MNSLSISHFHVTVITSSVHIPWIISQVKYTWQRNCHIIQIQFLYTNVVLVASSILSADINLVQTSINKLQQGWRQPPYITIPISYYDQFITINLICHVDFPVFNTLIRTTAHTKHWTTTQISTTRSEHQCEAPQNQNEDISYKQYQL